MNNDMHIARAVAGVIPNNNCYCKRSYDTVTAFRRVRRSCRTYFLVCFYIYSFVCCLFLFFFVFTVLVCDPGYIVV